MDRARSKSSSHFFMTKVKKIFKVKRGFAGIVFGFISIQILKAHDTLFLLISTTDTYILVDAIYGAYII